MDPYNEAFDKYQDKLREQILSSLAIPAALMEGGNYSSSRVALGMFEKVTCPWNNKDEYETNSGGSWIGEVQSP